MKSFMRRALALLLCGMLLIGAASADVLELPEQLTRIGEEAFANDASVSAVEVPDGVTSIGDRAFAGCEKLGWIAIPGSVTELGDDILAGCASDVLIQTEPGSAAYRYAKAKRIDCQAGTTYRALLVGQTEYEESSLRGPANDVKNMANCLKRFEGTPYQIETLNNLSGTEIKSAIREVFADAGPEDVSLFFYSGHGVKSYNLDMHGALVGVNNVSGTRSSIYVTADDLRRTLDEIPGRKIVLIDACYSGNMLSPDLASSYSARGVPEATAEDFVNSFMLAFGANSRANLAGQDYFVITAASDEEQSIEYRIGKNNKYLGFFTAALVEGCGYSYKKEASCALNADANGSGAISIREAYDYAYKKALSIAARYGESQHAQVYPDDCDWFGFLHE